MKKHFIKTVLTALLTLLSVACYGSNFNLPPGFDAIDEQTVQPDTEIIQPPPARNEPDDSMDTSESIANQTETAEADTTESELAMPESTGLTAESLLFPDGKPEAENTQENDPALQIKLSVPRQLYREGDYLKFTLKTNQACYLTLINEGTSGRSTVLFPSKDRPNNMIQANRVYPVPGQALLPDIKLQVTKSDHAVNDKEQITAICRKENTPLFNTPHRFQDYAHRVFDVGEDWRSVIQAKGKHGETRDSFSFYIE